MDDAWGILASLTEWLPTPYRGGVQIALSVLVAVAALAILIVPILQLVAILGKKRPRRASPTTVSLSELERAFTRVPLQVRRPVASRLLLLSEYHGLRDEIASNTSLRTFVRQFCRLAGVVADHPPADALWDRIEAAANEDREKLRASEDPRDRRFGTSTQEHLWIRDQLPEATPVLDFYLMGFYLAHGRADAWRALEDTARIVATNPSRRSHAVLSTIATLDTERGGAISARSLAAILKQ